MSEIVIYKAPDGHIELEVTLTQETLWLSQQQMADLFGTQRQAITRHLKNIFMAGELQENSVCSILEHTAADGKTYATKFYSLDAVISVGYRVNSTQATQFRMWGTQLLKEYLVKGHVIYKKRVAERGIEELERTVELLQKTLLHHDLVGDIGAQAIQLIIGYAKTWHLLLAYDENRLMVPEQGHSPLVPFNRESVFEAITALKQDLKSRGEASELFGQGRGDSFSGIISGIEQTFDGKPLYQTVELRAAHLLYFIIKDHPFVDGNKRIGCFVFILYLSLQGITVKLNDNGLIALALLVAESEPAQKEMLIRLIVNLLTN